MFPHLQTVSGRRRSSLADLVKFNVRTAFNLYRVREEVSLEATLLALHLPGEQDMALGPAVAEVLCEVSSYRDLLLLGDLASITQEKRLFEWIRGAHLLSLPAQTSLTATLLGLAMKLTGARPAGLGNLVAPLLLPQVPGGRVRGKARLEVLAYLAIIQSVAQAMAAGHHWEESARHSHLREMLGDLTRITDSF